MTESIVFDNRCAGWTNKADLNEMFLTLQEEYIKSMLKHNGFRYLNQIYEVYGIPWNPRIRENTCYLEEDGELIFHYDLFPSGIVVITIRQEKEGI